MVKGGKVACPLILIKMTALELYRPEALLFWSAIDEKEFMIYDLKIYDWQIYDLRLIYQFVYTVFWCFQAIRNRLSLDLYGAVVVRSYVQCIFIYWEWWEKPLQVRVALREG